MSDELRARLDDAITAARDRLLDYQVDIVEGLDHLTALVELRARWEVLDRRGCERRTKTGTCIDKGHYSPCSMCRWEAELEADVRRLLEPQEARESR